MMQSQWPIRVTLGLAFCAHVVSETNNNKKPPTKMMTSINRRKIHMLIVPVLSSSRASTHNAQMTSHPAQKKKMAVVEDFEVTTAADL